MGQTGVDHLDLVVSDLDRSLELYRALLEPLGYVRASEIVGERGERVVRLPPPATTPASSTKLTASSSRWSTSRSGAERCPPFWRRATAAALVDCDDAALLLAAEADLARIDPLHQLEAIDGDLP